MKVVDLREHIDSLIRQHQGNVKVTAELLGFSENYFWELRSGRCKNLRAGTLAKLGLKCVYVKLEDQD